MSRSEIRNQVDVLIVGAGVVGLSLAYELAKRQVRVRVVDRIGPGQEASWAGAGIIPPAARLADDDCYEQLLGLSTELHPRWADELRELTGIDNGYRRCGGVYLALDDEEAERLEAHAAWWQFRDIEREPLESPEAMRACEPGVDPALCSRTRRAWFVPGESQLRNPWHLRALAIAIRTLGGEIVADEPVELLIHSGGRVRQAQTASQTIDVASVCIASGAWSGGLLEQLGFQAPVVPVRGQIALLQTTPGTLRRIVNVGLRYLVPRDDGRVLAGSTVEEVGFDRRTTVEATEDLLRLARTLAPVLGQATLEKTWAGLRPRTADDRPYIGPVPGFENAFVAAGHFRSGLQLSPGTARIMSAYLSGETPEIDVRPLWPERVIKR